MEGLGDSHHPVLGGRVRAEVGKGVVAGYRGCEDYVPLVTADQPWKENVEPVDDSPQVDGDHPLPVGHRHFGQWATDSDSGVETQHLWWPEGLLGPVA